MSYSFMPMFPKGVFSTTNLSNTAQEVAANTQAILVCGAVVAGGAAAEVVIFRSQDGTTEFFRVNVAINGCVVVPISFFAAGGLEVITASAAGDVAVSIFYAKP